MAESKIKAGAPKARAARAAEAGTAAKAEAPVEAQPAAEAASDASERNQIEGTSEMTKETNKAADRFQAVFGDVNERAKAAVEKSTKFFEEATELTKGNVEAFVASSKIAAKGVESLGQEAADYGRKSFEEASAALKNLAEVKSPTDFFKLQSDYARSAFDSLVAESSKLSETVIKLAGEIAEPITNRYSVAAERVKMLAL